jgi:membrane protease subunit HflK
MITGILMSLNDPQWGNRPNQGPPDLEDLWRDFNRRLTGLFGKKGGGGNGGDGPPRPPMNARVFGGGIGAIVVLVLLVWLASGFYIVDASQRGVVLTFGKYSQTTEAGLRWRLPYPIQTHEIVKLSDVRVVEVGYRGSDKNKVLKEALMLTDDENIINIQFAVQWFLKDPEEYLFNNRSPDETRAAGGRNRHARGGRQEQDGLRPVRRPRAGGGAGRQDHAGHPRPLPDRHHRVQADAAERAAARAGAGRLRRCCQGRPGPRPPDERRPGLRQRRHPARTRHRLAPDGGGQRLQGRVVANAEGEASRFKQVLVEYNKAPEVTRQRLYLDTVQQVLSSTSKIMIDSKGAGNLLYLPLDKLMQAAGAPAAAANVVGSGGCLAARGLPNLGADVPPQLEALRHDDALARLAAFAREGGALMKRNLPFIAAFAIAALVALAMSMFTVDQRRFAIVFQLGEIKDVISEPGLNFKWPLIQNVRTFDKRILTYDSPEPERFITAEKKPVLVDAFVKWRIIDVRSTTSPCRATRRAPMCACRRQ